MPRRFQQMTANTYMQGYYIVTTLLYCNVDAYFPDRKTRMVFTSNAYKERLIVFKSRDNLFGF